MEEIKWVRRIHLGKLNIYPTGAKQLIHKFDMDCWCEPDTAYSLELDRDIILHYVYNMESITKEK